MNGDLRAQDKLPVTVIVLCGNEEHNIAECLETATWADELLVIVDQNSRDRTEEIARRFTGRILRHPYENYAAQQNWAIPQARHDWVFVLDADERITPELVEQLRNLFRMGMDRDGYWIKRSNYLLGKRVRFSGWGKEWVLRLFRRDTTRYQVKRVHAKAEVAHAGYVPACIVHYSISSMECWVSKINRYSSWKSQDKFEQGSPFPYFQLVLRPPFRFFKDYVLRLGVLDGWRGLMIAVMSSYSEFVMTAKLIERHWRQDGSVETSKKAPGRSRS